MYSASFIFRPGEYDDEFYELNQKIDDVARAMDGFIEAEKWYSQDGKTINSIYYWKSLDDVKAFSRHPDHVTAKRQYQKWYEGFHIVISEIQRSYGDSTIDHITPNERKRA